MASWGIMGGAAVDTYAKHKKDARDAAWEDQQRAEWARIRDDQMKLDAAVNGPGQAPPPLVPPGGLQVDKMGQGVTAPAPEPVDTSAVRMYKGDDGADYQTTKAKPRRSEEMIAQAQRIRASGTGVKGMELAMKLEQNASELMTRERDEELVGVLRGQAPIGQKMESLLKMIDDSPIVPGSVQLVQGKDGIYMQHIVPGRKEPFSQKVEGDPLQWMAMRVRAMTDPSMYFKQMEARQQDRRLANDEQQTKQTGEYQRGMLANAQDKTAAGIEIAAMRAEAARARGDAAAAGRASWQLVATDTDGAPVMFDKSSAKLQRPDGAQPKDPQIWQKVTGAKGTPAITPIQEAAAKKLQGWIVDNPDAPTAQIISMGNRLGVPPQAMPADPLAAMLPKPGGSLMGGPGKGVPTKAAAPAPARGLPAVPKQEDPAIAGLQARLNQLDKTNPQHVAEIMRLGTMINHRRQQLGQFN